MFDLLAIIFVTFCTMFILHFKVIARIFNNNTQPMAFSKISSISFIKLKEINREPQLEICLPNNFSTIGRRVTNTGQL